MFELPWSAGADVPLVRSWSQNRPGKNMLDFEHWSKVPPKLSDRSPLVAFKSGTTILHVCHALNGKKMYARILMIFLFL